MSKFSVEREMRRASAAERAGAADEAKAIYEAILERFPNNARARNALSELAGTAKQQAGPATQTAIRDLFLTLRNGEFALAASKAGQLVEQLPGAFQAWLGYATAHERLGDPVKAEHGYRKACELNPQDASLHSLLGIALNNQGKRDEAITSFERALVVDPGSFDAHNYLGMIRGRQGRVEEAIQHFSRAALVKPDFLETHIALAFLLKDQGRYDDAAANFRQAIRIRPDSFEAHYGLGVVLTYLSQPDEALQSYRQALLARPDSFEALASCGFIFKEQGRLDEAIEAYGKAVRLKPDSAEALTNMGIVLKDKGELGQALESFERAHKAMPGNGAVHTQKLRLQSEMCDWRAYEEFAAISSEFGILGDPTSPFAMLAFEDDPERQAKRSQRFAIAELRQQAQPLPAQPQRTPGKLRVGYFSANFHEHAMLHLMAGVFREHDKERFEIFAFSYGPEHAGSPMRQRVSQDVSHFIDIRDMPDDAAIELARSHNLHIAVDLMGYTTDTRSGLFAPRLAPVQINFLGYPGTMGVDFIDYIIGDRVLIPEAERAFYAEKVLDLPNTYWPTDNRQPIADKQTMRGDFGLPDDAFVFCCFNQTYKIGPREFDIWMRLLGKVKGSVLWLLGLNEWAKANLRREAQSRGVDPDRLVFAEKLPNAQHLARHRHADLFIDTFNYNAHTTASDALWTGLPLVTKAGRQFAARVGASLLTAISLPELITHNEEDYERLILDLATDPGKLAAIKTGLAENRLTQPLFDTVRYTRDLEHAFEAAFTEQQGAPAPS